MKASKTLLAASLGAMLLAGCAQIPPDAGQNPDDPYEAFNRQMYAFNDGLDRAVLKPVTVAYRAVVPEMARDGVSNVMDNMREPGNAVNSILQGKVGEGVSTVFRFLLNTTIGVGGLFDVASRVGIEPHQEDFGQTLAVWGVGEGSYLVLPILGPSSTRDVFRWPVQTGLNPVTYLAWDEEWYWATGYAALDAVDARSRMIDGGLDDMRANVVDEYAAVRSAYRQMRRNQVADGQQSAEEELGTLTPLSLEEDDEPAPVRKE